MVLEWEGGEREERGRWWRGKKRGVDGREKGVRCSRDGIVTAR